MKIDKRGRGKYTPALDLSREEIKKVLYEKILQEKETETKIDLEGETYPKPNKFNVLSLFCGAGGLDLGFELAGLEAVIGNKATAAFKDKEMYTKLREQSIFHTIFANDFFKDAIDTYTMNNPKHINVLEGDIRKVKRFPKANLVLGGFPCPGFSEAGPRLIDDERNFLYLQFIRCLDQSKPEIFVAENVKGMRTLGKGEVFKQIIEDFESVGYKVYHHLLNSREYGVPQIRERVFLIGVREGIDFQYKVKPIVTHGTNEQPFVSLRDAIGDLIENPGPVYSGSYSSMYMSRNRKKRWDEQSFTIQASGRQAPLHPSGDPMVKIDHDKWVFSNNEENNRRLSLKEVQRIQTFPDWYTFSPENITLNGHIDKIYKQVGNAVPVMLAKAVALPIAKWALEYLNHINDTTMNEVDNIELVTSFKG